MDPKTPQLTQDQMNAVRDFVAKTFGLAVTDEEVLSAPSIEHVLYALHGVGPTISILLTMVPDDIVQRWIDVTVGVRNDYLSGALKDKYTKFRKQRH